MLLARLLVILATVSQELYRLEKQAFYLCWAGLNALRLLG